MMIRDLAAALLGSVGSLLPDRVWRTTLRILLQNRRLIDLYGIDCISQIASQLNIVGVSVIGQYGIFTTAPNDDAILKAYAKHGEWASATNRAIQKFFVGGEGTYLDIGANIGMTVVPISAQSAVRCFAFEPEPANYRNLQINIFANCKNNNVTAFNLALFDRAGVLPFEISPNNLGDHRIRIGAAGPGRLGEHQRQLIQVPCARLDELDLPIHGPFFVKIDTQGAEPFVIAGGRGTLARADAILMEWAPYYMDRMGADKAIALEFLRAHFAAAKIQRAESDGEGHFQLIGKACEALSKSFSEWKDNPFEYVDVVAIK
jgi:FkbM family methyltransferase